MYIQEKHSSGKNYDKLLLTQLETYLSLITDSDIETTFNRFKDNIIKRPKFYTFNDAIDYTKEFSTKLELDEYIQEGAPEVIKYISDILVRQIILFKLMNEGLIMPCQIRNGFLTEIDINHNHGNSIFVITYNLLPYEIYVKI